MGVVRRKVFTGDEWGVEEIPLPDPSPRRLHLSTELYRGHKVYTTSLGLRFAVVGINKPTEEGIVFFTTPEMDWIRAQNLKPEEFRFIWMRKREDYSYCPIPEAWDAHRKSVAQQTATDVIAMLSKNKLPEDKKSG